MTCREGDQRRTCRPIAVPVGVQDGAGPSMHCWIIMLPTGWGPPVMWTWVYKPWNKPYENYSYIYHKATEIRQLNAILGAPSCMKNSHFWHVPFFRPSNGKRCLHRQMLDKWATTRASVRVCCAGPEFADLEFHQKHVCLQWHCIWECPCFFPQIINSSPYSYWWFGTWLSCFIFFHIGVMSSSQLTFTPKPSFFRLGLAATTWRCDGRWRRSSYWLQEWYDVASNFPKIHPIPKKPCHPSFLGGCFMCFICFFWHFPSMFMNFL